MTGRRAGRPPTISREAVVAAGVEIGLEDLTVAAVAERLGVTRTSVHRHAGTREDLETLVGEHLVAAAPAVADTGQSLEEYLLEFARSLAAHTRAHPGLAAYYARGFPRTATSARVVEDFDRTLVERGIPPVPAARLAAAVANSAVALTAHAVLDERYTDSGSWLDLAGFPILAAVRRSAETAGPDAESWFDWSMRGVVRGLVALTLDPPPL